MRVDEVGPNGQLGPTPPAGDASRHRSGVRTRSPRSNYVPNLVPLDPTLFPAERFERSERAQFTDSMSAHKQYRVKINCLAWSNQRKIAQWSNWRH
ncbi:hypothetical protein AVEN_34942-1 [Araneus ventricosus]|uniref:Uncharacterized protein n=1 Tax=Araneus ventricosus TaxID=182803 RepID=A0A4Y2GBK1_ARAVE|nr:hypothetical protein AVEN_34942-1 [Araneus ventricosus]